MCRDGDMACHLWKIAVEVGNMRTDVLLINIDLYLRPSGNYHSQCAVS